MLFQFLLVSVIFGYCRPIAINGYFYIYEWPDVPISAYPNKDVTLTANTTYSHTFSGNHGIGDTFDADIGLFQTWQFGLFKSLFNRLLVHPKRTRDPSKATVFIVPFDFGAHATTSEIDGSPPLKPTLIRVRMHPIFHYIRNAPVYATIPPQSTTLLKPEVNTTRNLTLHPPLYWKNNGHDHILILSTTMFCKLPMPFYHIIVSVCKHCIILSIESSPTFTPFHKGFSQNYIYPVPYPASFHYHEKIKTLPWLVRKDSVTEVNKKQVVVKARDILSLFIGSILTTTPTSTKLRRALFTQYREYERTNTDPQLKVVWVSTAHTSMGVLKENETTFNPMTLFPRSVFCLSPAGDSYTRKATFDSLVGGCIPVIFTLGSISQYLWFLSEQDVRDVSVYIPMYDVVFNNVSYVDVLSAIPADEVLHKQQAIARIAPRLQYSVVPDRYLNEAALPRLLSNTVSGSKKSLTWQPPFRDAVDVIVDKITDVQTLLPKQPGQMNKADRIAILSQTPRQRDGNEFALLTREECIEVDMLNRYMRGFHPHWNGGLTTSRGLLRKYMIENTTMKSKITGLVKGNLHSFKISPNDAFHAQEDQYARTIYWNTTHMILRGTNPLNSTLFAKLKMNPNLPFIKDVFKYSFV